MGFYAKGEATPTAGDLATADPKTHARKCKPGNAIRPILTVGVGHRYYSPSLGAVDTLSLCEERGPREPLPRAG